MTMRAMGATNARLPVPTGMVIGHIRDPKKFAFNKYCQFVPVPEDAIEFSYWKIDPDEPIRMQSGTATNAKAKLEDFAWAYDAYPPSGKDWSVRMEQLSDRVMRYAFPYIIGDEMRAQWSKVGLNPESLFSQIRTAQAGLHRAIRIVSTLTDTTWTGATSDAQTLLSAAAPVYFDESSGTELTPGGLPNPNYATILNTFQAIKRRIHLNTNGALDGTELVAVLPVAVAQAIAKSGEMREFLKQSPFAKELINPNLANWNLPETYGGFTLVVEDTPRVFLNKLTSGAAADRSVAASADYVLNEDTIYFLSRPGGVDGGYGHPSFSTLQCYYKGGLAEVKSNSNSWAELTEARIEMADKPLVASIASGFELTNVLSV